MTHRPGGSAGGIRRCVRVLPCLGIVPESAKGIVANGIAEHRNHGMRCKVWELRRRIVRSGALVRLEENIGADSVELSRRSGDQRQGTCTEGAAASGNAFGFYECLGVVPESAKGIVANGIAEHRNHGMRCEVRELRRRVLRRGNQGKGNVLGSNPTNTLRRAERVLLAVTKENPLRYARLDIGFNPLVNDIDHLFSEVGEVIEASQFEGLKRSLRAPCKVVKH